MKDVLPQLKSAGKVTRGWLGVSIQAVTPELAASLGLDKAKGALVSSLPKNSPAEQAGIKAGDVIIEYGGKEIKNANDLPFLVAITPVGKRVPLKVLRDRKETTLTVTIGKLQEEAVVASTAEKGALGLTVQQITPEMAANLGLGGMQGVVVTAVEPGSAADEAGLQPGDIVREVNRKPVRNLYDFRKATEGAAWDKGVLFLIQREDDTIFLALRQEK